MDGLFGAFDETIFDVGLVISVINVFHVVGTVLGITTADEGIVETRLTNGVVVMSLQTRVLRCLHLLVECVSDGPEYQRLLIQLTTDYRVFVTETSSR